MFRKSIQNFLLTVIALLAIGVSISPAEAEDSATTESLTYDLPAAGEAPVVGQEEIDKILSSHGADLLVVNFWATWCGPCVEELPYFVKASKTYKERKVVFLGISVDFKKDVEKRVIPFLKEKEIPYANVVFYGNSEDMINFFSTDWKGDIPATFFYDRDGNQVGKFLRPVEYEELTEAIDSHLPKKS